MLALFFIVRAVGALSPSMKLAEQLDKLEVAVDTALTPSLGLERVADLPWWWAPAVQWLTESEEFVAPGKNAANQPWRVQGEGKEQKELLAKFEMYTDALPTKTTLYKEQPVTSETLFNFVNQVMRSSQGMKSPAFALANLCTTLGATTKEELEESYEALLILQPDMEAPDYKIDDAIFEEWKNRPMVQLLLANMKAVIACGKVEMNQMSVRAVFTSMNVFNKKAASDVEAATKDLDVPEKMKAMMGVKMMGAILNIPKQLIRRLKPFFDAAGPEECPFLPPELKRILKASSDSMKVANALM